MPVTVDRFLKSCADPLRLHLAAGTGGLSREITDRKVQKTGLGITGEVDSTHPGKIQILGETEITYFRSQPDARQTQIADHFFSRPMACAIAGGSLQLPPRMVETAERRGVPLLVSELTTSDLIHEVLRNLEQMFAETTMIHGVLVEILGVGVVLLGKSGIGKSECALDLILRGHRFVADDIIYLEKWGPETVLGTGEEMTRHHMEIRGLGIINIRDLFGPTAIVDRKKVEMIIQIEEWDANKEYDRLGLEERRSDLLGVSLSTVLIPVSPGRNLATIVEVAVRNYLLKTRGIFTAAELVERQSKRSEGEKRE
ncbi:MAG TPA: HPr(Ser) kinase/phosphatase [Candidatus Deferrimicrobiaceae bacterium]|nr:HPr(Ser) kinase/phosphatase [Candidatus Deferrimicrobiaceae bacterium]